MAALTLFPLQYKRQDSVPVDIDVTFATTADRVAYLTSPRRYAGMLVVDTEEDRAYLLNSARDAWIAVGSSQLTVEDEGTPIGAESTTTLNFIGDNVTVTTADDGITANVAITETPLSILNEGSSLGAESAVSINFVGPNVVAASSDSGATVTVTVSDAPLTILNEGSSLGSASTTTIDFVGANVTASSSNNGALVTVTVSGGGGGSLAVQDEGVSLGASPTTVLNFIGAAVTATSANSGATVDVTVVAPPPPLPTVYEYNQASVTLQQIHLGNIVRMGFATTQTYIVTETIGSECSIGTSIVVTWAGIGLVTIVQGANAVILTPETLNIRKRYGQVTLTKMVAPNIWQVEGNLQSS